MSCYIFVFKYVGAIYFSLGNLDPALRSRLEAIHLVCIFPYTLLDVYRMDDVLTPLMTDTKKLQMVGIYAWHCIVKLLHPYDTCYLACIQ